MARKTIRECDRCHAQFDMSDPIWEQQRMAKRVPTYRVEWKADLGVGDGDAHGEIELCEPCRDQFIQQNRKFVKCE